MRGDADATESRTSVPGLAGKDFREGNEASENRPDLLSFDQHQPNGTTARDADHVHNSGDTLGLRTGTEAESEKLPFLRPRHRALCLIHLELERLRDELRNASHPLLPRPFAANV